MTVFWPFLFLLLWAPTILCVGHDHDGRETSPEYSNEWVVHLEGDRDSAELIALKLGYECLGEINGFPDHYLMRKADHPAESRMESPVHTRGLEDEGRVVWAQQQFEKTRVKRRPEIVTDPELKELIRVKRSVEREELLREIMQRERSRDEDILLSEFRRLVHDDEERGIPSELLQLWKEEEERYGKNKRQPAPSNKGSRFFNDELWDHQWYMQDTRTNRDLPEINLHILPVFELGYTGEGVRVCVLDDGIEGTHRDLRDNYDPEISYDYNNGTHGDPDPTPRYPTTSSGVPNSHGTRCAGEIAMAADNGFCGVGVAHKASIGGIRMLDGKINDKIEGLSLQHAVDKVDIFTASWGPSDDGKTVEAPGHLAQKAMEKGIKEGRKGKGIIYVWAAGNGGMHKDNCNCDGYTSSIYTISIGSASEQGEFPWYGEQCASTMASTYSSGAYTDQKITTTDTNNTCTVGHTGTSAAAPLAAGIIALALEANPNLTWRDVQHLVARCASSQPLWNNPGWKVNGAGLAYNSRFGFGIMDAYKFVTTAKEWTNVGKQEIVNVDARNRTNSTLISQVVFTAEFVAESSTINYLEHVEVVVNIAYPVRGALEVVLLSPLGTISQLLTARPEDKSADGFKQWKFMSCHFWGENPSGVWKLYIVDKTSNETYTGEVGNLKLFLFGTTDAPSSLSSLDQEPTVERSENVGDVLNRQEAIGDLAGVRWDDLVGKNVYVI